MVVGLSGPTYCLNPGDEADFPQAEAVRLIEHGVAAPAAQSAIERAVIKPAAERRKKEAR